MNELITIGNQQIAIKEYKGQRVVTFKDIDTVHERPDGTARKRFNDNKNRLASGRDYIVRKTDEAKEEYGITAPNGLVLITERGYLMLVKSFTDDLAWEVQGQLVDNYFTKKSQPLTQQEMMRIQLGMIDDVAERVDKLENTMVIDYGQQRVLERLVAGAVITALGGKDSPAYREIGKKVFSECNRDIKDYFDVNSRNNIPRVKFDDACKYIRAWQPCTNTKMMINDCNAQMCMA